MCAAAQSDVPEFQCLLRTAFLYDLRRDRGEFRKTAFTPVVVFGIRCVTGYAIGFHVITDTGEVIWNLPIHSLAWHEEAPPHPLPALELWDCFSEQFSVHAYGWFSGARVQAALMNDQRLEGTYVFTVDYWGNARSDGRGDIGHKCHHFLRLDDGNFAALPNNRIRWASPAFVTRPFEGRPDYVTHSHVWQTENNKTKWVTSEDEMFYAVHTVPATEPAPAHETNGRGDEDRS